MCGDDLGPDGASHAVVVVFQMTKGLLFSAGRFRQNRAESRQSLDNSANVSIILGLVSLSRMHH
jgi:hypothetical protein